MEIAKEQRRRRWPDPHTALGKPCRIDEEGGGLLRATIEGRVCAARRPSAAIDTARGWSPGSAAPPAVPWPPPAPPRWPCRTASWHPARETGKTLPSTPLRSRATPARSSPWPAQAAPAPPRIPPPARRSGPTRRPASTSRHPVAASLRRRYSRSAWPTLPPPAGDGHRGWPPGRRTPAPSRPRRRSFRRNRRSPPPPARRSGSSPPARNS